MDIKATSLAPLESAFTSSESLLDIPAAGRAIAIAGTLTDPLYTQMLWSGASSTPENLPELSVQGWLDTASTMSVLPTNIIASSVTTSAVTDIGNLTGAVVYTDAVSTAEPTDVYQFTLTDSKNINLWLDGLTADADVALYGDFNNNGIIDVGEEIKRSDWGGTDDEFINISGLSAGRYFIEVYQYSGDTNYTLHISDSVISQFLPTEVSIGTLNSTYAASGVLNGKNSADVYQFNLGTDNFNLSLTGLSADADVRLIRDVNNNGIVDVGEEIARSQRGANWDEAMNLNGLATGSYFLQVYQYSGNTAYTLNLSPSGFSNLLPTEINVGPLSGTQTFGNTISNTNTADTYRFDLNAVSQFNLSLTGLSADADVRLIQDNNNNGIIDSSDVVAGSYQWGNTSEAIATTLQAGQYWVQVLQYSGNTNYTLSMGVTSITVPTDNAGNTFGTAQDIGTLGSLQTFTDYVGTVDTNDFYRFNLTELGSVTLNLSGLSADADMQLIRDANNNGVLDVGEVIAYPWADGTVSESLTIGLDAGDYLIRVFPYSGSTNYTLTAEAAPLTLPTGYNINYGYGLVDAATAVASAVNQTPFSAVPNLGGNNWNLDLVNAPEVWAQGYTGQNVVVAVIDTGVDYTHPDLNANIWVNSDEVAGNGVDDDGNGFIDDVNGWDFVNDDNSPLDTEGHGTHVAGTIAAENNGTGVTGVAYNATIMPVQVLGDNGGTWEDVANGILYAANNGADVINLSLGGGFSTVVADAIAYAQSQGAVVVMASGNDAQAQPGFPGNLSNQYGISVGAVNQNNQLASFSNDAGIVPVDYVVAPGVSVYSTTPGNTYAAYNGTSMATPHVAGVAALILSANPSLTPEEVIALLTSTANGTGITV